MNLLHYAKKKKAVGSSLLQQSRQPYKLGLLFNTKKFVKGKVFFGLLTSLQSKKGPENLK